MRNRPDSGSTPRRPGPQAHGGAASNNAAAAVTISGLGNRSPNASIARSSPVASPSETGSRTFSAHITSPPTPGRSDAGKSVDVRPNAVALPPCGLAASGARDLPSTDLPAEPCLNGGWSEAQVEPFVDELGALADGAMLGIGVPAPRSPGGCRQRRRQRRSSWSGAHAPCPVYVRSPDKLSTSALLNAAHTTHTSR